ncbi:PREDICTED: nucleolar protein 11 [Cyphomyrmex costatus]|uniref:Nucleolar protein 11 n=1 Tax=Cyphomyrmex costatus TaxID=456900 RepID=A0A195C849_9HYME|nr:PREDICTED: nucleolar protein 11 [Cyphomyrmex costatus]KYM96825.1 Nucleolar protein 11 [Cyphomyrmex costatus]
MAKLSSYYTLCPLIDQQSLLGVEKDKEPGCAIVTLGRNIVIRYKLQDLKQISSWSSKERLTTQVIYDRFKQRYVAVFNERKIRVWSEEEADLNNVKGHKFSFPLYAILPYDDSSPILVQQNGATASLAWAIDNRKTWMSKGIIRAKEKLLNCQLIHLNGKTSLFCLTRVEEVYNYIVVGLEEDTCLEKADTIKRIELKRKSEVLTGHVVIHHKNDAYLLTLWSHGRLYSHLLTATSSDVESNKLISVITNINTKYPIVMTHLNETTIAIYGADVTDEGAILMIYNVQFKSAQAVQKLKLYTNDAKLWKVEDKLLLAANRHLAVAPYHLAPQRIAAMLGSSLRFKNDRNDADDIIVIQEATVAQWDKNQTCTKNASIGRIPVNISKKICSYLNEGWSDSAIQEIVIPTLMESDDVASVCWCLDTFKDLPEKLLVDLLAFTLKNSNKVFVSLQNGTTDSTLKASNPYSRNNFLDRVLSISYSSVLLLPHLKTGLTFDQVLKLLEYLMCKLNEKTDSLDENSQPNDQQLYEWFCMLLDSHYQHYLLSQDTHVLELFNRLDSILEEHFQFLQNLVNLRPMIDRTNNGKPLRSSSRKHNKFYSIEEIKLY